MQHVLELPAVRCMTKNSFLHFEAAAPRQRQRCYSDATHWRSPCADEYGYDSDSTVETVGARERSPSPATPRPEQPYLLDLVSRVQPAYMPQDVVRSEEVEPKKPKKRRDAPAQDNEITLMVRNIPNKYTPESLLQTFNQYRNYITFYYLPTDFKNKCNLGYAFVNFCDREVASCFAAELENSKLPQFEKSEKVLIVQPARVQGLSANMKRFRNSSVMGVLPEECKPMLFEDGVQKPFPAPGKKIPPVGPRFRPGQ